MKEMVTYNNITKSINLHTAPQYFDPGFKVWRWDVDDLVEPSGSGERGVEGVGPVGGAHHDHVAVALVMRRRLTNAIISCDLSVPFRNLVGECPLEVVA